MRDNLYRLDGETWGHIMTRETFIEACDDGVFIDYDGHGECCVQDGPEFVRGTGQRVVPSTIDDMDESVTHVMWFNK